MSPSSKEYLDRSPEGTAMLAGLTGEHIAMTGRLGSGPALGQQRGRQRNKVVH